MAGVSTFRRNRLASLARLRRVNLAIAHLDEYEAAQFMPADIRPQVHPPDLGRDDLKSLRETVEKVLAEMELMWERRN